MTSDTASTTDKPKFQVRFTPWKLISLLLTFVLTILISLAISALIPTEDIPRVDQLENGMSIYWVESIKSIIMPPVVTVILITCLVVVIKILPNDGPEERQKISSLPNNIGWILQAICVCVVALCLIMMTFLLYDFLIRTPLEKVRSVSVDRNSIDIKSLFRSWSYSRNQIGQAQIVKTNRNGARTDIVLAISMADGKSFKCAVRTYLNTDPELAQHQKFLEKMRKHLFKN